MNNLSNEIYRYYLANWHTLPADKQFHFASRLWLWDDDPQMGARLRELFGYYSANAIPDRAFQAIRQQVAASPVHGSKNAAELRRPYFERYPNLKLVVSLLFRANFLETVYGLDSRATLQPYLQEAQADNLYRQLLQDDVAIAMLSTHAINFFYLYQRFVRSDEASLPLERFYTIGQSGYDHTDKLHLQLLIYLYTHCIIGEARFYYRSIPPSNLPLYQSMVAHLEQLIAVNFQAINLDNKCEFLVCASLVGVSSSLQERILAEAVRSVSPDGRYIIDCHNTNPQHANTDLAGSEHRNVLYVMATQARSVAPKTALQI